MINLEEKIINLAHSLNTYVKYNKDLKKCVERAYLEYVNTQIFETLYLFSVDKNEYIDYLLIKYKEKFYGKRV